MSALDRLNQLDAQQQALSSDPPLEPMSSGLLQVLDERAEHAAAHEYAEIKRIVNLPLRFDMTEEEQDAYTQQTVLAEAYERGFRLLPEQANAVCEYELTRGLCGPIGVGRGKTLITILIAAKAYSHRWHSKMLLLVPAQVRQQFIKKDIPLARSWVPIPYPILDLGGYTAAGRRGLAMSGKRGLYVMTYELLSSKDAYEILEAINPTLIIGDEAHRVANYSAARTRRLFSFLDRRAEQGERVECCWLSGTITGKSIRDYHHLARSALKDGCPLPLSAHLANAWAAVVDAESVTQEGVQQAANAAVSESSAGPLMPLVHWARKGFPHEPIPDTRAGFRRAFRLRLNHCPGVVASGDAEIPTSLILANQPIEGYENCEGWEQLEELLDQVVNEWRTPNGDEIEHAIHTWKWINELSAGFYNELTWPTPEKYAERHRIDSETAWELLERAKQHHAARQVYAAALRKWLEEKHRPGLDTPLLVGQSMHQHGSKFVGHDLYEVWSISKEMEFEGMPERDSRAVRVCPYKVDAAIEWAKAVAAEKKGAIVWYWHRAVGRWLFEKAVAAGLDAIHCPAGKAANDAIVDQTNRRKIVIASIKSHGEGKNLQHFEHQYVVQWPRSAKKAEQMLGRLHRTGQLADEIVCVTNNTLEHDEMQFAASVVDALYIHQTVGTRQKLVYASYDPLPRMFPPAVLQERGLDVKPLTPDQQRELRERFAN